MNNAGIQDFIRYFVDQPKPGYAVMLTGAWGCGKTHFIQQMIEPNEAPKPTTVENQKQTATGAVVLQRERVLYLPLNGIDSLAGIDELIWAKRHPVLASAPVRVATSLVGAVLKSGLKLGLNVDVTGDQKPDLSVGIGASKEKANLWTKEWQNEILIFDDLERCSIPITVLLGYINTFVEHSAVRVIIIGHEKEILEREKSISQEQYRRIKEKVVGRTFEIRPDFHGACEAFLNQLDKPIADCLTEHLVLINGIFHQSGHANLRILRHSLLDLQRLLKCLDKSMLKRADVVSYLSRIFLPLSLEVKAGNLATSDIGVLSIDEQTKIMRIYKKRHIGSENDIPDSEEKRISEVDKMLSKYFSFPRSNPVLPWPMWKELIAGAEPNTTEIQAAILSSHLFPKEEPEWKKLWRYEELSDEEASKLIDTCWDRFSRCKLEDLGVVFHHFGLFLEFVETGLVPREHDQVLETAKSCVREVLKRDFESGRTEVAPESFYWNGSQNLGYRGQHVSNAKSAWQVLQEFHTTETEQWRRERWRRTKADYTRQLDLDPNCWPTLFPNWDRYDLGPEPMSIYFEAQTFADTIIRMKPRLRQELINRLRNRYERLSLPQESADVEVRWYEEVATLLEAEAASRKGKVSGKALKDFVGILKHSASMMSNYPTKVPPPKNGMKVEPGRSEAKPDNQSEPE